MLGCTVYHVYENEDFKEEEYQQFYSILFNKKNGSFYCDFAN